MLSCVVVFRWSVVVVPCVWCVMCLMRTMCMMCIMMYCLLEGLTESGERAVHVAVEISLGDLG